MRAQAPSVRARPGGPARGFTLIELLIGMAIIAILSSLAGPYFVDYVANSRLREGGNAVHASALYAQSEAIKRNGRVRWSHAAGVITIDDITDAGEVRSTLRTTQLANGISTGNGPIVFGADGMTRGQASDATLDIAASGITCSSELRCPRLVIEVGGSMRLCGDKLNCT